MHVNWRDCQEWRKLGLPLSTTNNECARLYDAVLTQFVSSYDQPAVGGIVASMEKLAKEDPHFVMGRVLLVGMELMGVNVSYVDAKLQAKIQALRTLCNQQKVTQREKKHVEALEQFGSGRWEDACLTWEEIILDHPTDSLALKCCRDVYFYRGCLAEQRDVLAKALKHWTEEMPLYTYFMGHYAFSLSETSLFAEAEKTSRRAIALNPMDNWSLHSLAHTLESQGRYREGAIMMGESKKRWGAPEQLFTCHVNWHHALFHMQLGDYDTCLNIFDEELLPSAKKNGEMFNLADSSSLLLRLNMQGVSVGSRWGDIMEMYRPNIDNHVLAFHDAHIVMTYAHCAVQEDIMEQVMTSLRNFIDGEAYKGQHTQKVHQEVGYPLAQAFEAYGNRDYDVAVETMRPIRYKIQNIGGSNAQREVFNQFFLHCCTKSSNETHHRLARGMLVEREVFQSAAPCMEKIVAQIAAQNNV